MASTFKSKTLTVAIGRPPKEVAGFVANPSNLPKWAKTFCRSIRPAGDAWIIKTPQGEMRARFAPPNDFGVVDHYIQPAAGPEIFVPLRVAPNGGGSEVVFTLFQLPGMSDEGFAADAALVEKDLQSLKEALE